MTIAQILRGLRESPLATVMRMTPGELLAVIGLIAVVVVIALALLVWVASQFE